MSNYDDFQVKISYFKIVKLIKFFFFLFCISIIPQNGMAESSLTLHVFQSPYGIDWATPKSLIKSVLRNSFTFKDRKIGHVAVELSCEKGMKGIPFHLLTGMSNSDKHIHKKLLLLDRVGFSVIFGSVDGLLEPESKLIKEIKEKSNVEKSPRYNFIKFLISNRTCVRLEKYYRTYVGQLYYKKYGLPNNPRKGEGAGCSAFGASFLEVAGILNPEYKNAWSLEKKVSYKMLGGKENLKNPQMKVSLFDLLFMNDSENHWLNDNEEGRKVFFYDPDLMFKWINHQVKTKTMSLNKKGVVIKNHKVFGLQFDFSTTPTPLESPWIK